MLCKIYCVLVASNNNSSLWPNLTVGITAAHIIARLRDSFSMAVTITSGKTSKRTDTHHSPHLHAYNNTQDKCTIYSYVIQYTIAAHTRIQL